MNHCNNQLHRLDQCTICHRSMAFEVAHSPAKENKSGANWTAVNKTQAGNLCQRAQHNQDGLCHCDDMHTAQLLATLANRIKLLQFEVNTSSQACRSFAAGGMGCRDTTVLCGQF